MIFKRKKKQLPPVTQPEVTKRASARTKAAVDFFNDKKSPVDMLEKDGRRKFVHSGYTKTKIDHFFEWLESQPWGSIIVFVLLTAFVAAAAYWGIKQ